MRHSNHFFIFILFTLSLHAQKIQLFNGIDLTGWYYDVPALDTDKTLRIPFVVRDKKLVSLGTPEGHLITDAQYENYELEMQYRFPNATGNCGILVHCSTPRMLYKMFPKSIEVQLMHDNAGDFWVIGEDIEVKDMEKRRKGPREKWGSTEDKERRIVNLIDGAEKKVGKWNKVYVKCYQNTITVKINGKLVNDGFNSTVSKGQIALQAEGSEIEFRKITLTHLK
jgi:hypothetical protein